MTRTCEVRQETLTGQVDEGGEPEVAVVVHEFRCELQQSATREAEGNQDLQASMWNLYVEADAADVLAGTGQVVVDGVTFDVHGDPWAVRHPRTGEVTHIEARLRRAG